ncbi:PREDICTED: uncharacterized protein LOC109129898 [Camelina sativa]|uniref:Uncharacterized protein LOC109129898 n=1 Tax=Camelina sativa TaxID=90675 RepID=A0ABM1R635_CAMSA|nr:PREDICTED: uncharacterized protein LOC109129898 [Camelina sativa]
MENPSRVGIAISGDENESIEDDGRPPGGGPDGSLLWVDKVRESGRGGILVPEKALADDFVKSRMSVEFPSGLRSEYHDCSTESTAEGVVEADGGMTVLDLPRQFFMIRFDSEEDYMTAVTGGPWRVMGSILMVQAWDPGFDPLRDEIVTTPVWVRISNLPINFYHRQIVLGIAEGLGRPLRVDLTTMRVERARFARVCIEVNLKKPLKGCGVFGHLVAACPRRVVAQVAQNAVQLSAMSPVRVEQDKDGFTQREGRDWEIGEEYGGGECDLVVSNRFRGLVEEGRSHEVGGSRDDNKENEDTQNIPNDGNGRSGKELVERGGMERVHSRVGDSERRSGGNNGWKGTGVRNKGGKGTVSTRGLVFGPMGADVGGFSSGKRLRVDSEDVGREGGAFTGPRPDASSLLKDGRRELGGDNLVADVTSMELSGGLWLLWRESVGRVEVLASTDQFIHAQIQKEEETVNLVVVYAAPTVSRRSGLWEKLSGVIRGVVGPLIIGGDFNTILRLDERTWGNGRLSADSLAFGQWISDLALIDMGFKGNQFTWKRGKAASNFVAKRLDRVLCCAHARLRWQEAVVSHLPFFSSDHVLLYVQLNLQRLVDPRRRPFRFEAAWVNHEGFKELVRTSWSSALSTPAALDALKWRLKKWNREVFGHINTRKEGLVRELKEIQDLLAVVQTDELICKEEQLLKDFETLLEQEETLWFQKSREKHIELGDRNTAFFHLSTVIRRKRNKIEMLKDDEDRWVSHKGELESMAVAYYKRLYSLQDVSEVWESLSTVGLTSLTDAEKTALMRPFTGEEVVGTVKCMGSFKAPGPDGFQPVFYQKCWETVGSSVTKFVLDFFESGVLPESTNDALLVLIAKVAKPERITQFRPVSLCNVLFKIITKMMVLRLKTVISKLIGPAQSSFIPGRLSVDNIVVVHEVVHSMRRKKGRKGWMLLKLDLEKAYDRVRWDFLEETLVAAGLPANWVTRIMAGVTEPSMSLLWNGERTDSFTAARGLRQGDPLSPYLFVLCLERLCHQIEAAVGRGDWKPIAVSRGGPKLSHVCFADDLILFAEASVAQVRLIRGVLESFCLASGQKVSLEKSKIYFSNNVSREMEQLISAESGIGSTRELGKYLGMPILQKRINKDTFGEILERVSARLSGWKSRSLSLAGRLTLTKSVLSSLPVHLMGAILLPEFTSQSLDKLSRAFVWGSTAEKKRQHLLAWKRVCVPKQEGGLGLRPTRDMNRALIAKVGWRLLHEKDSLWARVLTSKYKVRDVHDQSWLVSNGRWSSTWRSICVGFREVISKGIGWVSGDGKIIRFWSDRWLLPEPLSGHVTADLSDTERRMVVEEYWIGGVGWDIPRLSQLLPLNVLQRLYSVVISGVAGFQDALSWQGTPNGEFTVRSAYSLLTRSDEARPSMANFFACVWGVVAPERVRVFLWQVSHQVIMTNVERVRRHMGDSVVCKVCSGAEESILHVLRDCPAISGIWRRLVPQRKQPEFFDQSLLPWLFRNLRVGLNSRNGHWSTLFSMTVWWAWKWRCSDVFGERRTCRDMLKFVKDMAEEVHRAHSLSVNTTGGRVGVEQLVKWVCPNVGWVKLTTDGASRGNPGLAAAGGAIRDREGAWLGGFAINIGVCTAPLAELWGVYYGLHLAWGRGFRRVELEVDSLLVVGLLKSGISSAHPLSFLVRLCQSFVSRDWLVRINHVYREANRLADGLANYAFSLQLGFHSFNSCPDVVCEILREDAVGTVVSRAVRL